MKIMVAFLSNKKNNSRNISKMKSLNSSYRFNDLNNLNKLNNFSRSQQNKNYNTKIKNENAYVNKNKVKDKLNNMKNSRNVIRSISRGEIYAKVVSNTNVINRECKNCRPNINKERAISNLDEILGESYNKTRTKNVKNKSVKEKIDTVKIDFKFSKLINFLLFSIPLIAILITNSPLATNILIKSATNFRQAENLNFEVSDLAKSYGLYNTNNYVIKEEIIQKAEVKEDVKEDVIVTSNEEIIDKEAEIEDVAAFFGNDEVKVEITENSNSIQRVTIGNTKILNYSSKRDIDYAGLINSDVILTKKSDKILLYNTHTSESYTNSDGYKFEYTGTMRTTDAEYNMLTIAKKFNENLKQKGFESVQDTTPHDYGTYTSAYAKSRITVKNALESMSGAGIIIDVHRDASSDLAYRPVANVKGVQVAQLMFVVGVGSSSTQNDNWQENLKLALKLQQMADIVYPGLFRPMIIRNSVYNQDLNKYALLIEFGATGNTIEEVKLSTRCMTNLLNILYKD